MRMHLPRAAQYAMRALTGAGYQAYIVGGSVRDVLLGREPDDYDITTNALPDEVMALFRRDKLVLNGLKHGTVRLIKYAMPIEITTFRIDGDYEDARHPDDVVFTGNLYEDVQRRDFTINALCWNEKAGLIDYTGGQEDIENRLVRCVGVPEVRFSEDALRILRALRFSATLDFDIDPPTAQGVHACGPLLGQISAERILIELRKLVCGARAESILIEYRDVFEVLMPELRLLTVDEYLLAARRVALISPAPDLRLAALLCDLTREQAHECGMRLKFSKASRGFIDGVIEHAHEPVPTDRVGMRRALNRYGDELLPGLVELRAAQIRALTHMIIQQDDCVTLRQLALNGEDVFQLGVARRKTGECLNSLLERVMANELENTREALGDAVRAGLGAREEDGSTAPKRSRRRRSGAGKKEAEPPLPVSSED